MAQQRFFLRGPVVFHERAVDTIRSQLLRRFGDNIRMEMYSPRWEFFLPGGKCCVVKFENVDTTRHGTLWQLGREHHHRGPLLNLPSIVVKSGAAAETPLTDEELAFFVNLLDSVGLRVIRYGDDWCTNCVSRPSSDIYKTHDGHKTPAFWHKLCDICLIHSLYGMLRIDPVRKSWCPQCGNNDEVSIEALNRAYMERPVYKAFVRIQTDLDYHAQILLSQATSFDVIAP